MEAIRRIQSVGRDGYLHVPVPQLLGKRVEIIVLPLEENELETAQTAGEDDQQYFCWDAASPVEGMAHTAATVSTIPEWREETEDEVWT